MDKKNSKFIKFDKAILSAERKENADVGAQTDKVLVAESGLFDDDFYTEQVGPISNDISPIEHFLINGENNLASPSRAFDSGAYVEKYRDVKEKEINPLLHYLKHGVHEGRQKISVSVQEDRDDQLKNEMGSLKEEAVALIANSSYFDDEFYVDTYADLLEDYSGTPSEHYADVGINKNLKPSLIFDPDYYLKTYNDVKESGQPAFIHYIKFGEKEGRRPNSSVIDIPRSVLKKWAEESDTSYPHVELLTSFKTAERARNWGEAESSLRKILELENESAVIYSQLATILRNQGKWWQEIEALHSAIKLEDYHAAWHYRLAEAQEVMSRFQQAAASYGRAIELKKGKADAEWHYRQGYCYAREGHDGPANLYRAKQVYQQAIDKDTKLDSKRFGIGVFHQKRGHWVQAAEAYARQLSTTPLDAELNYRLGMAYDRCYEWGKAEHYYTLALGLEIDQPDWHYRLGFVRERQKKYFEASEAYQYAALTRSRHTPYWFYRWGYVLEQAGEYKQACDAFLQTRQQPTLDAEAVVTPQELQDSGGDEQQVEADTLPVAFPLLEQYKKELLTEHQVARINSQLAEDCTSPALWYWLGNVYERQQQWQAAATAYKHAELRANEQSSDYNYRLGYVLFRLGKHDQACDAFRKTRIFQKPHGVSYKLINTKTKRLHASYAEYQGNWKINKKSILFESNHGRSITCNPYAIFEEIISNNNFSNWIFLWVINDMSLVDDSLKKDKRIVFVERNSDAYLKWLACAEYLINNSGFPYYFTRRDEQKYLETWHGTPFKTLGKKQRYKFFSHRGTQRNFFQATHIISPNKHTTNIFLRDYELKNIYKGELKETGYPRNDKIINFPKTEIQNKKIELGIDLDKPVVLYAPTWRGSLDNLSSELEKVEEFLEKTSHLGYEVLFRGHNYVETELINSNLECKVVSSRVATNEILPLIDILISDYSSILFDFAPLKKPFVLYTYDIDEYKSARGLYFEPEYLGIASTRSVDELIIMIKEAIEHGKHKPSDDFIHDFCRNDDGYASKRVVDFFFNESCDHLANLASVDDKKNVLIFPGSLEPNGISTSLVNLLASLNNNLALNVRPIVAFSPNSVGVDQDKLNIFNKIDYSNSFFARYGYMPMGIEELYLRARYDKQSLSLSTREELDILSNAYKNEFQRVFGLINVDCCVHFSGYDPFWCNLFAFSGIKNTCFLHNDLYSEYKEKFSYLDYNFNIYREYDFLASVSDKTSELNKKNLAHAYKIPPSKFGFVDNLQNPGETLRSSEEPLSNEDQEIFKNASVTYITLGRLSVEKDHEKLIYAFSHVHEIEPGAKLLILGEGPLRQKLVNLVSSMGLSGHVLLMGARRNPFPLLKAADCFVLSSNHEGQPMVLFEAMILNKPIISTDIIGSRSVIEGRSGHLVENNIAALAEGMIEFYNGNLVFNEFDLNDYQKNALKMFYEKVCNLD